MSTQRQGRERKVYETPRLVVYGDIRTLTTNLSGQGKADNPTMKS
jgi:hypothetical protein